MTPDELHILASAYIEYTGIGRTTLSCLACGNNGTLSRLERGLSCYPLTLRRAEAWFAANWPPELEWPLALPRVPPGYTIVRHPGGTSEQGCSP